MTNRSTAIGPLEFAFIIYVMIGLAPLLFEHPEYPEHSSYTSHTSSSENLMKTIEGLLNPLDQPATIVFALAGGVLLSHLQKRD